MLGIILIILYTLALGFILLYSIVQINLVISYVRERKKISQSKVEAPRKELSEFPFVTVQLPIFNEIYVIERLMEAVAAFDYPKDRYEIQVLDDSNDETLEIVAAKVEELKAKGIQVSQVLRPKREGFKAGALQYGMESAKGEFIAIFDADFVPGPDFLKQTLPHFADEKTGVVQTRWGHINENYSLLTRLQAFALDAHFSVEQKGRYAAGHFINFNGTAGVWRRACIAEAGGWQSDTLTEDLDLSYRAQLKGWKFVFLEDQVSPAELPVAMPAIKSQQFRWTKGAAEVARKNLGSVLRARIPFATKLHATFHLMNSMLFICILLTALLSFPLLSIKHYQPEFNEFFKYASVFMLSLVSLVIFFWTSRMNREKLSGPKRFWKFISTFPLFLAVSMGLSLHNAWATLEGYLGFKSPFIRTPKFSITDVKDKFSDKKYLSHAISIMTLVEGLLCLYFGSALVLGIIWEDYGMIPFHFMLCCGFGAIFYYSVAHSRYAG
ncbi:MAG: glycosyltransferase [Bacteroidia bacterium]|nr:glycosyltransferase [Bacteroidia bacterium]